MLLIELQNTDVCLRFFAQANTHCRIDIIYCFYKTNDNVKNKENYVIHHEKKNHITSRNCKSGCP
jgi:hypothetical protein